MGKAEEALSLRSGAVGEGMEEGWAREVGSGG